MLTIVRPFVATQVLQRLPAVRSELMHCLVLLAGALHTLVHSDKAPPTEKDAGALLQVGWQYLVVQGAAHRG